VVLKDNMLVNVGEAYMVVNLFPEGLEDYEPHDTLKLKIFGGNNNGDVHEYSVNQMQNGRQILMGRANECDIKIDDKLLSKVQCHIQLEFSEDGNYHWMLYDGGPQGKASTNGTWLYINEDVQVYDGMVFKANQTIFSTGFYDFSR
jgi:hypothetical protein